MQPRGAASQPRVRRRLDRREVARADPKTGTVTPLRAGSVLCDNGGSGGGEQAGHRAQHERARRGTRDGLGHRGRCGRGISCVHGRADAASWARGEASGEGWVREVGLRPAPTTTSTSVLCAAREATSGSRSRSVSSRPSALWRVRPSVSSDRPAQGSRPRCCQARALRD